MNVSPDYIEAKKLFIEAEKYTQKGKDSYYSSAITNYQEATKYNAMDGYLSHGALGFVYTQKNQYYEAIKEFENERFLLASTHKRFLVYVIVWLRLYFKLSYFDEFENISFSLQNYYDKKQDEIIELSDRNNKKFNDDHFIIKIIKALKDWKINEKLERALNLLQQCEDPKKYADYFTKKLNEEIEKKNKIIENFEKENNTNRYISRNHEKIEYVELEKYCSTHKEYSTTIYDYAILLFKSGMINNIQISIALFEFYIKLKEKLKEDLKEKIIDVKYYIAKAYIKLENFTKASEILEDTIFNCNEFDNFPNKYKSEIELELIKVYLSDANLYNDPRNQINIKAKFNNIKTYYIENININLIEGEFYYLLNDYTKAYQSYMHYKKNKDRVSSLIENKIKICGLKNKNRHIDEENNPDYNPSTIFHPSFISIKLSDEDFKLFVELNKEAIKYKKNNRIFQVNIKTGDNMIKITDSFYLFDYIHGSDYPQKETKMENDKIDYPTKIKIIKKISEILALYYKQNENDDNNEKKLYLSTLDFFYTNKDNISSTLKLAFYPFYCNNLNKETDNSNYNKKNGYKYNWCHYSEVEDFKPTRNFIYSFGVIIWEILTRKIPYPNINTMNNTRQISKIIEDYKLNSDLINNETVPLDTIDYMFCLLNWKDSNYDNSKLIDILNKAQKLPNQKDINEFNDSTILNGNNDNEIEYFYDKKNIYETLYRFRFCKSDNDDLLGDDLGGYIKKMMGYNISNEKHLVKYKGYTINGEKPSNFYIYTEILGDSLYDKIRKQSLSELEKYQYIRQLAQIVRDYSNINKDIVIDSLLPEFIYEEKSDEENKTLKILNYRNKNDDEINNLFGIEDANIYSDFISIICRMFKLDYGNENEFNKYCEAQKKCNKSMINQMIWNFIIETVNDYNQRRKMVK